MYYHLRIVHCLMNACLPVCAYHCTKSQRLTPGPPIPHSLRRGCVTECACITKDAYGTLDILTVTVRERRRKKINICISDSGGVE